MRFDERAAVVGLSAAAAGVVKYYLESRRRNDREQVDDGFENN